MPNDEQLLKSETTIPENTDKYSFFPIQHRVIYDLYKEQSAVFWTPEEINMSKDRYDFNKMTATEKHCIKTILSFFANFDGIVCENLVENFQRELSFIKELKSFYAAQNFIEVIHAETYGLMITTFIDDEKEREMMFDSIKTNPDIKRIGDWVFKWMNPDRNILERVVAFCILEGVIFQSAFAIIYFFKRKNILEGLTSSNELIARDEGIHTRCGVEVFHLLTDKQQMKIANHDVYPSLSNERIKEIFTEAMDFAIEPWIKNTLQSDLIGLSTVNLLKYVKTTADSICEMLCGEKIYNEKHTLDFMINMVTKTKTNYFEKKVLSYSKVGTRSNKTSTNYF